MKTTEDKDNSNSSAGPFDINFDSSSSVRDSQEGSACDNQDLPVNVEGRLLKGLNSEQRRAVLHDKGPLLILAGAGSGKTRVITHRIAYLVQERGVSPYRILAITFTNKAAKEMKNRIEELIGQDVNSIWVGTFHSMLVKILRKHIGILGFDPSFTIIDSDDQQKVVKQCLTDLNIDEKMYPPKSVHSAISSAKNSLIGPAEYAKDARGDKRKEKIAAIYELYQSKLKMNSALDFDDILYFAVEILKQDTQILDFYRRKFEYILVDEYQDTNHAQYTLIQLLAGKHQNLCVVGDDDQSIYAFRGANIQNILDFEKDFKNCTVIKLEQNYRSTRNVLDAANCVISNNKGRKDKKLWTQSEEGSPITFLRAETYNDEAQYVASEITRIVKTAKIGSYREIAILYRLNALSRTFEGELMKRGIPYRVYGGMRFFDRKEIKDILAYLRLIIKGDDLSFMRIVNVPRRGIGDVTLDALQAVATEKGMTMLATCAIAKEDPRLSRAWPKLYEFYELITSFRDKIAQNDISFPDLFEYVQEESGILQEIIEQRDKKSEVTDRVENLKELISDAVEFERQIDIELELKAFREIDEGASTIDSEDKDKNDSDDVIFYDNESSNDIANTMSSNDFADYEEAVATPHTLSEKLQAYLDNTALFSELDKEVEGDEFVRLMTIHSAKGLEFDFVFLVGAEETLFPGSRSIQSGNPEDIEEERRLAYVSITRSRKKLYITTARNRMVFGQTQCLPVSRFVREIPECYVEEVSCGRNASAGSEMYGSSLFTGNSSTVSPGFSSKSGTTVSSGGAGNGRQNDRNGVFGQSKGFLDGTPFGSGKTKSGSDLRGSQGSLFGTGSRDNVVQNENDQYLTSSQINVGDIVNHPKFGKGKIIQKIPAANDAILEIEFVDYGPKKLMTNQAKLTK
jgi:DNA helicase-2/ATP-dependent DNA helicase PcrA